MSCCKYLHSCVHAATEQLMSCKSVHMPVSIVMLAALSSIAPRGSYRGSLLLSKQGMCAYQQAFCKEEDTHLLPDCPFVVP